MANPIRTSKMRLVAQGYDPASGSGAYGFDCVAPLVLPAFHLGAIIAGAVNTTVQVAWPVPQRMEIQKVWFSFNAGAVFDPVNDKFNLVIGNVAELGAPFGAAWAIGAAGSSPFADQAIGTAGTSGVNFVAGPFLPSVMTAWYDTGSILSLRLVTSAAVGTHINANSISIGLMVCLVDPFPAKNDAGSVTVPNF